MMQLKTLRGIVLCPLQTFSLYQYYPGTVGGGDKTKRQEAGNVIRRQKSNGKTELRGSAESKFGKLYENWRNRNRTAEKTTV